ncbi:MAG TPA: hypothetical protein VHL98_03200 [Microvirga sp.]|nr:hypothetical protein [Microvirga sp.]
MTTATLSRTGALPFARPSSSPARSAPRRSLLRRLLDAVMDANRRRAEREIAAYIRRNGGAISDQVERGIERSLLSSSRF